MTLSSGRKYIDFPFGNSNSGSVSIYGNFNLRSKNEN
ncbi:MAG: hypothetical protein ACI9QL_004371, partial [Candidatus Omnitrophota bacterium]